MNKEVKLRNVAIFSSILIVIILVFDIFFKPENEIKTYFVQKQFDEITSRQQIAPLRLYINVYRKIKDMYVDKEITDFNIDNWRFRYMKHIKTMEDADIAINSMITSLYDVYTEFLMPEDFLIKKAELESKINGLGIIFKKNGNNIEVLYVQDGSLAKEANIRRGDIVIGINGKITAGEDVDEMIKSIEDSGAKEIEITLRRRILVFTKKLVYYKQKEKIPVPTMEYKITKDNVGIIKLFNIMGDNAPEDFREIIGKTNDTKAIIIDLRDNQGGIVGNAVQMANYLMNDKKVLSIKSRLNRQYQIYSANEKIFKDKPIVLLINHNTASAAEILAGCIRDNLQAVLVGEKTFGKTSIQRIIPLPDKTGLILTTDKYILPKGEDISQIGLNPDIKIKQSNNKNGEDKQLKKALEILKDSGK